MKRRRPTQVIPGRNHTAFSLVELLVVVAVIAILAGLLLPALTTAKATAQAARCLNNHKQLQLAWLLYAGDHDDQLPPNGDMLPGLARNDRPFWWAQGVMNYRDDHPDNTNTSLLLDERWAQLGNYTKDAGLYRCPSDRSVSRVGGQIRPRVRSVSMNIHVGRIVDCFVITARRVGPDKVAQIPNPAMQFVFVDEHPDSIGGTAFWIVPGEGRESKLLSYPSALHRGGAVLSFADGHVEAHRWLDSRTRPPVKGQNWLGETDSPENSDVRWLHQRTFFPEE
ncbi:MAG TPA: prepilin-type N-terminal cleavage/methylation domain-containing protein [Verrucomicrobiota bacterium]|nr:prepilin-type N-terminal cleavage/methylation domain-containing protein [Verrucomicrobiota bacterium]